MQWPHKLTLRIFLREGVMIRVPGEMFRSRLPVGVAYQPLRASAGCGIGRAGEANGPNADKAGHPGPERIRRSGCSLRRSTASYRRRGLAGRVLQARPDPVERTVSSAAAASRPRGAAGPRSSRWDGGSLGPGGVLEQSQGTGLGRSAGIEPGRRGSGGASSLSGARDSGGAPSSGQALGSCGSTWARWTSPDVVARKGRAYGLELNSLSVTTGEVLRTCRTHSGGQSRT